MRVSLAWVVGLSLALGACRPPQPTTVPIDPALATLVPDDTVLLAGARMEAIRKTEAYRRFIQQKKWPVLEEFVRDTGLDPRRDLWEFLAVSNGKNFVVMARGKFSAMGLEPRLDRAGARRMPYKGYMLLGDDRMSVVFPNTTTAMAGSAADLRAMLDQRDKTSGIPAPLRQKLKEVPPKSHIWAFSLGGPPRLPGRIPPNLENLNTLLGMVQSATLAADLQTGLDLSAAAECAGEQEAKQVHDALRGILGLARLSTPSERKELFEFYDSIQVSMQQRTVRVQAGIGIQTLEALEKAAGAGQLPGSR